MVHTLAVCAAAGAADFSHVPAGSARLGNLRHPRLRIFRVSPRPFSARMFLARGIAILESLQQLRRAVPRAMEHDAALPAVADLPPVAAAMVAGFFLPAAFVVREIGRASCRE